jgi:hypothetical protein
MTNTDDLRARMRAWIHAEGARQRNVGAVAPLEPEGRRLLQQVRDAGGSHAIRGLELRDMVHIASVVLDLQRSRLVRASIRFTRGVPAQPEEIQVELTEQGQQAELAG